jgi:short-subunit dehydrogenase
MNGSKVLITGASSGIGAATARLLAGKGAVVALVGRRADPLSDVLAGCRVTSPDSRAWVADLSDLQRTEEIADEAWDVLGEIDVLINNAAVPKVQPVPDLTPQVVESVMQVNFFSPVRLTLRLLPKMLARGSGMIVNVASMGGRLGIAHEAAYCSSKFALTGWSEAMAIDLHGTGVKVRLIQPGPIATDIWSRPGERRALYEGPLEPPEVVAEGILAALDSERFEHFLPDLKEVVSYKTSDIDGFLSMAAAVAAAAGNGRTK